MSKLASNVVPMKKKGRAAREKLPRRFFTKTFADIDEKNIRWVLPPYLARGMITLLEGNGAAGKTPMAQEWAKAVADGTTFPTGYAPPEGHYEPKPGIVVCNDVENELGSVNKKYFEAIGAKNQGNIWPVEEDWSVNDQASFDQYCSELDDVQKEKGEIALIIFDTIATYTGGDLNGIDIAGPAMAQFKKLAERYDCAVLLLRHWNKAVGDVRYRGSGHNIITNKARIQISANNWSDEDHLDWYALRVTKINVGIRFPKWAMLYSPESLPERNGIIERFRFEIDRTPVEMTLAEFSEGERHKSKDDDGSSPKRRLPGQKYLIEFCSTPKLRTDAIEAGRKAGFSDSTLDRAKAELENEGLLRTIATKTMRKHGGGVKWFVPDPDMLDNAKRLIVDAGGVGAKSRDEFVEMAAAIPEGRVVAAIDDPAYIDAAIADMEKEQRA